MLFCLILTLCNAKIFSGVSKAYRPSPGELKVLNSTVRSCIEPIVKANETFQNVCQFGNTMFDQSGDRNLTRADLEVFCKPECTGSLMHNIELYHSPSCKNLALVDIYDIPRNKSNPTYTIANIGVFDEIRLEYYCMKYGDSYCSLTSGDTTNSIYLGARCTSCGRQRAEFLRDFDYRENLYWETIMIEVLDQYIEECGQFSTPPTPRTRRSASITSPTVSPTPASMSTQAKNSVSSIVSFGLVYLASAIMLH